MSLINAVHTPRLLKFGLFFKNGLVWVNIETLAQGALKLKQEWPKKATASFK